MILPKIEIYTFLALLFLTASLILIFMKVRFGLGFILKDISLKPQCVHKTKLVKVKQKVILFM